MLDLSYSDFAKRLTQALKLRGHVSSRSPNGICMKTLASFADASEQICRRYIRGEALPSYEKIVAIAAALSVSPSWLLFGEKNDIKSQEETDDELLSYILVNSQKRLQTQRLKPEEYADFVLGLLKEIRDIDTSLDNRYKIIDLAIGSASNFGLN